MSTNFLRTERGERWSSTSMLTAREPLRTLYFLPPYRQRRRRFWCRGVSTTFAALHAGHSEIAFPTEPGAVRPGAIQRPERVHLYNYTLHSNRRDTISSGQKSNGAWPVSPRLENSWANVAPGGASSPRSVPHVFSFFPSLYEETKVSPPSIISIHAHEHIHARMHTRESALRGRKENATPKGDSLSTLSSFFPKEKKWGVGLCVSVCV